LAKKVLAIKNLYENLTFAGPQNAQNNDFFMYTKTGLDLKIFDQI
jgi:hypothetical protein